MGKRDVVEGRTQDIRWQQLGKLKDLVTRLATKAGYDVAMKLFLEYLR